MRAIFIFTVEKFQCSLDHLSIFSISNGYDALLMISTYPKVTVQRRFYNVLSFLRLILFKGS